MKAQFNSRRTVARRPAPNHAILTSDFSGLRTASSLGRLPFVTAPPIRCWRMSLPNLCRGTFFCRFKAVVLGHQHVDTLHDTIDQPLEERVEDRRSDTNDTIVRVPDMNSTRDKTRASYADVVQNKTCVAEMPSKNANTHVGKTAGRTTTIKSNNILSRAHSLERIQ